MRMDMDPDTGVEFGQNFYRLENGSMRVETGNIKEGTIIKWVKGAVCRIERHLAALTFIFIQGPLPL